VEVKGLLDDLLPAFDQLPLAHQLRLDPPLEEAKAVHVLELGLHTELLGARRANRDVAVNPEAPLLHVHVRDAELADRGAQELSPLAGLRRGADVGLGDDLDQRRAPAVEVHQR
jgi:hypothetical protein